MALRIATHMAIAMALAMYRDMAHSTPLHSSAGSHSSSGEWGPSKADRTLAAASCRPMNELRR